MIHTRTTVDRLKQRDGLNNQHSFHFLQGLISASFTIVLSAVGSGYLIARKHSSDCTKTKRYSISGANLTELYF